MQEKGIKQMNYSGGRDQERSQPGQIVCQILSRKKPLTKKKKKGWWNGSR
jgi:hypothetical protein